jgi:flagellar basal body rod protein FlgB
MNFIGRTTQVGALKQSLDISAQRVRTIADRVAQASAPGSSEMGPIDVDAEMASLADEQLRYEATAKFLEKAYSGLRESLREK